MAKRQNRRASAADRSMGARFREMRLRLRPDLAKHQAFGDALHPPVTAQTIRNWEAGTPSPPDKAKRSICELLNCVPSDFYGALGSLLQHELVSSLIPNDRRPHD